MGNSTSKQGPPATFDPTHDIPDLQGKVALVTGGNAGMGFYICSHLRAHGARVIMATRSEERARAAIQAMEAAAPEVAGSAEYIHLDLEDLSSVQNTAAALVEREERLDIVVNNAAVLITEYSRTPDGMSKHMAVNHIGHFLLMNRLEPLLLKTARREKSDVRVVTLTSNAHTTVTEIDFSDPESFNTKYESTIKLQARVKDYGLSKLANLLMSNELQKRYDAHNIPIICTAVHPAIVGTDHAHESIAATLPMWATRLVFRFFGMTPEEGSYISLFASTHPKVKQEPDTYKGKHLVRYGTPKPSSLLGQDEKLASQLWATTVRILQERYGIETNGLAE